MESNKSLTTLPTQNLLKPKSFWEKDEGTTGMILLAAMVFGGGFILLKLLPFIITLLSNIITASILAAVVGLIFLVATSPRTATLLKYIFKKVSQSITYAFIEYDPFGILRTCRDEISKMSSTLSSQVNNLRGQKIALKRDIDGNTSDREKAASMAKRYPETAQAKVNRRQFMRLSESNEKLAKVYRVMEVLEAALSKYDEACGMLVEDINNEIRVKEKEYKALSKGYSAIQTAKKILSGGTDAQEVFDMTMEYLAQDYGNKMGEIEGFLKTSQSFIAGFDLQNDLYDEQALKAIEQWTKQSDSLLLGDKDDLRLLGPSLTVQGLDDTKTPNYVELLNKVNN
jgi:hypothetical protein